MSQVFDDDGNLTEDSKFIYTWNGDVARKCEDGQFRINCAKHEVYLVPSGRDTNQNRLIQVTPKAFEEGAVELHFVYDHQGRRVSKERRLYNPASMKFEFEKRIEYIFAGWNVILEKATEGSPATAGNTILTKRYWGLDLSGSTQGAGGVGGLLATFATKSSPATAGTETHYYHYDANGNVTETVDSNGNLTASYEYGPFGELVSETGSYASENTYRFSTKPIDVETGYYYYGYRYYDSANGRWLNRDPMREGGGINLYAFIINKTLNAVDILGLEGLGAAGAAAGGASSFRAGFLGSSAGLYWNLGTILGATLAKAAWEVFGMCSSTFQGETFHEDDEDACYVECYDKCEDPSQWQDNGTYTIRRKYRCVGNHKNFIGKELLSPCSASCSSGDTEKESPSEAFE